MDGSGDQCCVQFGQGVGITSRIIKESLKKKKGNRKTAGECSLEKKGFGSELSSQFCSHVFM